MEKHTAKPPSIQAVKVCVDPQCWEVAHNFPKGVIHCRSCGGRMIGLDKETYQKEYILSPHQFDYSKDEDEDCRVNPYEIGYKHT
ncbi:hypothetical protein [Runella salmonicolor]|uniref:Uncharacterized protein n=1 Tax=Runella salmonicolor TaxID=2950278 RepID=A0ABT1FSU7_9BACT|nr:hypothetical protein [Runella salmonicolor]MCP1384844.1 hypothetical protein [Runella salmonicolor]